MKCITCSHAFSLAGISLMMAGMTISAAAEEPVNLGSAADFAVLAGSTVTNVVAEGTIVTGDLGVSAGTSVTGFPPGIVIGSIFAGGPVAAQAQVDLTNAYNDAAGRDTAPVDVAGNLGGMTLGPGLYKSTSSLAISSGDLTLDGQGDCNAVFIFQMASTLSTTADRKVILIGGAQAANVFWQVGSSATFETTTVFQGTVMAAESISLEDGAVLNGRALARSGGVTLSNNFVTRPPSTQFLPGDINGDCIVNVADVTALGNYVRDNSNTIQGDGDINNDGVIDELDVIELADQIVNGI